jgi:hypothetical protein
VEPAAQGASLPIPEDRSAATARPAYAGESPYAASCPTETVLSSMFADARIGGRQSAKRQRGGRRRCSRCSVGSRHGPCRTLAALQPVKFRGCAGRRFPCGPDAGTRHAGFFWLISLLGAGIGTAIGLQWMSEHTMRYDIITTLLFGGLRLLLRQAAAHLAGSTNKRRWQSSAQHPG